MSLPQGSLSLSENRRNQKLAPEARDIWLALLEAGYPLHDRSLRNDVLKLLGSNGAGWASLSTLNKILESSGLKPFQKS